MAQSITDLINEKAKEIDSEIERHHVAIASLEADRLELTITLQALKKHGLVEEPVSQEKPKWAIGAGTIAKKLTVPEMIARVLRDYKEGAEPNIVLAKIRERYDENIDPNNVRPTMWRMEKDGRLGKSGDKYHLPQKNEAAGTPSKSEPTASVADQHAAQGGMPVIY